MHRDDIARMSVSERIQTMEDLWDSLLHDQASLLSPSWHEDLLVERKRRIDSGEARFLTLDELKKLKTA